MTGRASPSQPAARFRAGFSLLELGVVVCIVALLASVALDRLLRYQELGERAAMENTASVIRSALGLRFAALYLQGNLRAIERLPDENPMDWLADRPGNYSGALWSPRLEDLTPGDWYYDRAAKLLVYYPNRRRYLEVPTSGDPRIQFRVLVDFSAPRQGGSAKELRQLGLHPVSPYKWFD